jgi:hypothetical protein
MANDFSGDSNILALYNFESGALTTDSKGSNTLTDVNTVAESATCKQGACSADFELSNSELFYRADADLPADWPFKNGTTNNIGSFTCWFQIESFPGGTSYSTIFGKFSIGAGGRCFRFGSYGTATFRLSNGYNTGASVETFDVYTAGQTGRWYFIGLAMDVTNRRWYYYLWDDTAAAIVAGGWWKTTYATNIEDAKFTIGGGQNAATTYQDYHDGLIDECTVWKAFLSQADIIAIKAGTYSSTGAHITTTSALNWHINLVAGNNYNSGENWTYARKDIPSLLATSPFIGGDEVKFAKSTPVNCGAAQFTNDSDTITFDSAPVINIDMCEATFTSDAGGNVVCGTSSSYFIEGTKSCSIQVKGAFTTGLACHKDLGGSLNLSGHTSISFWIYPQTALAANSLRIDLCSDTAGATPQNSFTIDKAIAAGQTAYITMNYGGALYNGIQSIAFTVLIDFGASDVTTYVDNFIATSNISLTSVIGKNDGYWWPIQSINGATVKLGRGTTGKNGRNFVGATTKPNAYITECIPAATQINYASGDSPLSLVTFSGGWDTAANTHTAGDFTATRPVTGISSYLFNLNSSYVTLKDFIYNVGSGFFTIGAAALTDIYLEDIQIVGCNRLFLMASFATTNIQLLGTIKATAGNDVMLDGYGAGTSHPGLCYGNATITILTDQVAFVFSSYWSSLYLTGSVTITFPSAVASQSGIYLFYSGLVYIREAIITNAAIALYATYNGEVTIEKLTVSDCTSTVYVGSNAGLIRIVNLIISSGSYVVSRSTASRAMFPHNGIAIERLNADNRYVIEKMYGTISDHITGGQAAGWAYGGSGLSLYFNPSSTVINCFLPHTFLMPVVSGTEYKLHMQVIKTSAAANCTLKCTITGAGITVVEAESVTLTDSWAEYLSTSFTPTFNGYVRVELIALDGSTTGDIGVDDIHLAEV